MATEGGFPCTKLNTQDLAHKYLNSKMYVCSSAKWVIRRECLRNLVADLIPNTPCAPPPRVWNLVTSGLPYMVNVSVTSINKHIQNSIEHAVAHGVNHWSMLCFGGAIASFIP